MRNLRQAFDEKFGTGAADKFYAHVVGHENGIHDKKGSDDFRWAVIIAIGHCCFSYSECASIGTDQAFRDFCYEHRAYLLEHDGDCDFLALVAGSYKFLKEEFTRSESA